MVAHFQTLKDYSIIILGKKVMSFWSKTLSETHREPLLFLVRDPVTGFHQKALTHSLRAIHFECVLWQVGFSGLFCKVLGVSAFNEAVLVRADGKNEMKRTSVKHRVLRLSWTRASVLDATFTAILVHSHLVKAEVAARTAVCNCKAAKYKSLASDVLSAVWTKCIVNVWIKNF